MFCGYKSVSLKINLVRSAKQSNYQKNYEKYNLGLDCLQFIGPLWDPALTICFFGNNLDCEKGNEMKFQYWCIDFVMDWVCLEKYD